MIAGLYEPLLQEAIRYDRTTYTFTAKGLIAAAAGTAGLIRNGGRIRLICDHTVRSDILQALHDGQIQAETALSQSHIQEKTCSSPSPMTSAGTIWNWRLGW